MTIFYVLTHGGTNLVIESEEFELDTKFGVYEFCSKGEVVASVPTIGVFAVISEEAFAGDIAEFFDTLADADGVAEEAEEGDNV